MRCHDARDALSAHLDGEDPGVAEADLDTHLARCGPCRAHAEELAALHRMARVRVAETVPDLTATILAAAPVPPPDAAPGRVPLRDRLAGSIGRGRARDRDRHPEAIGWARWALFTVALTQLVLAAPGLVLGEAAAITTAHVARELGAFEVALAAGMLVAAWQPARAYGLLPLAMVLGAVLIGTAVIDVLDGGTRLAAEGVHLLEVAGVALLWRVAKDPAATFPARRLQVRPA